MDIPPLLTVFFFSAFSFAFPYSGTEKVLRFSLPRGYVVGVEYLLSLVPVWILLKAERRHGGKVLNFLRTFYPQILITPFFTESIHLSTQVFGGVSHDAFFIALDQRIFGFEPYLIFYKALETVPRFNELMFGSYFSYYILVATLLWIPWLKGDRKETERSVFIYFAINLVVIVWYVFFRVQGPKYWISELRSNWYGNFRGYLFVKFFQNMFNHVDMAGAAFPSSHALFTALCVVFGYRWDKRLLGVYLPILSLIMLATIYIYAHYAVDILTGILLAPLLYLAFARLYGPCQNLFQSICEKCSRPQPARPEAEPKV
jgi:membrane-associated phospholipid phosphatase